MIAARGEAWLPAGNGEPQSDIRILALAGVSRVLFAERIEVVRWRDGLVVTAYLGEVGVLELQGKFHQGVCDVSGGFVGDGVFG
jgi:hypothetical protein